ncbi:RNA degradosome polyphosphate kinase [Babesia caballi]|uniref:RNA degradosome polyphosphate kinase n=1 Tax=Babesia caballi TaxID=5871 RepID=A0AAV4M0J4_BABCB|nr:RNA degradosome polyphosphate kinase [Babesia caballi]
MRERRIIRSTNVNANLDDDTVHLVKNLGHTSSMIGVRHSVLGSTLSGGHSVADGIREVSRLHQLNVIQPVTRAPAIRKVGAEVAQQSLHTGGLVSCRRQNLREASGSGGHVAVLVGGVDCVQCVYAVHAENFVDVVVLEAFNRYLHNPTDVGVGLVKAGLLLQERANSEDDVGGHENRRVLAAILGGELGELLDELRFQGIIPDNLAILVVNECTVKVDARVSTVAGAQKEILS